MIGNSHHTYGPPPARGVLYPSQYYGGQPHPWPGRPEYYQHNPPNSSGQSYFPPSSRASDQGGMYDGYAPADQGHHYQSHEIGGDKGSMYSNSQQDQGWTQQVHPHPHALRPDERESDEKQPPSRLPLQENYEYSNYSAGTQMSYSSHAAPFEPPPPPPSEVDHHNMKPSQYWCWYVKTRRSPVWDTKNYDLLTWKWNLICQVQIQTRYWGLSLIVAFKKRTLSEMFHFA